MSSSIQTNFNISAANAFIDDFSSPKNSYYLMISKPSAWSNDNTPPASCDNTKDKVLAWTESIAAKRMTSKNLRLVTKRCDWTNEQSYSRYDDTEEIFKSNTYESNPFYVLTSDFRVYKCISDGPSGSTVEPNHTNTHLQTPNADGYVWQFMYQLSEADFDFLTDDYMPVSVAGSTEKIGTIEYLQREAQENAKAGGISHIELHQGGAPWYDAFLYDKSLNSDFVSKHLVRSFTGATAFDSSGNVINTTVLNILGGDTIRKTTNDFYNGWALRGKQSVDSVAYQPFYKKILKYEVDGESLAFSIEALGNTAGLVVYTSLEVVPYVYVDGDTGPTGESGTVIVEPIFGSLGTGSFLNGISADTKNITSLKITDPGSGVYNPTVHIYPPPGNSAAGAGFSTTAVVSPLSGHGSNAPRELGANKVMVRMLLKGNEGGDFDVINDYRQFSIVKNPEFSGFSADISPGTRAGSLDKERTVLSVKNPNNVSTITFTNIDGSGSGVVYNSTDFTIGEKVCQGSFNTNQPRGTVVGWTGAFALGVLQVSVTNGQFRSTASGEEAIGITSGKITKGETTGTVFTGGSAGFISTTTNSRSFYNRSFVENDIVLGMNSRATGKVVSFQSDSVGETGKLTLDGVVGDFNGPKVSLGTLVDGETVFGFRTLNTLDGTVSVSGSPVGVISKIESEPINIDLTNRLTTKFTTYFPSSSFFLTGQELDQSITGSTSGANAFIVNAAYAGTGTTSGGGAGSTVDIFTTKTYKEFQVGEDVTLNNLSGVIRSIDQPEFSRYSGEVLYIENVRPVQRNADQEEEIKLVIDF